MIQVRESGRYIAGIISRSHLGDTLMKNLRSQPGSRDFSGGKNRKFYELYARQLAPIPGHRNTQGHLNLTKKTADQMVGERAGFPIGFSLTPFGGFQK